MDAKRLDYLRSIANELQSQARRVRELIGDGHWLSDGHQKEYLLGEVLRRHLPAGMSALRGFSIGTSNRIECSKEQDLLIFDTMCEGPVFNQGGLAIVFPGCVRASVSVKSTLEKKTVVDSIKNLNSLLSVAYTSSSTPQHIWCGAYFYEISETVRNNPQHVYNYFEEAMLNSPTIFGAIPPTNNPPRGPCFLASSCDLVYRIDYDAPKQSAENGFARIQGFKSEGLASTLFLASLLGHVASTRGSAWAEFTDFVRGFAAEPIAEHSFKLP